MKLKQNGTLQERKLIKNSLEFLLKHASCDGGVTAAWHCKYPCNIVWVYEGRVTDSIIRSPIPSPNPSLF